MEQSIGMEIWQWGIGTHALVFILNAVTINDEVMTYIILGSFFNTAIIYPLMFRYLQEQLDKQKSKIKTKRKNEKRKSLNFKEVKNNGRNNN